MGENAPFFQAAWASKQGHVERGQVTVAAAREAAAAAHSIVAQSARRKKLHNPGMRMAIEAAVLRRRV